jgi:hypothetical protein
LQFGQLEHKVWGGPDTLDDSLLGANHRLATLVATTDPLKEQANGDSIKENGSAELTDHQYERCPAGSEIIIGDTVADTGHGTEQKNNTSSGWWISILASCPV